MKDTGIDDLARDIVEAMPELTAVDRRLAGFIYRRLAKGVAVAAADIAAHSGVELEEIEERLASWPGVERNAEGLLVSFWGLALGGMPHGFTVGGEQLTTWCAWDAFFIPGIIGQAAQVRSTCPVTGATIALEISPERVLSTTPVGVAVSIQRPAKAFGDDVVPEF